MREKLGEIKKRESGGGAGGPHFCITTTKCGSALRLLSSSLLDSTLLYSPRRASARACARAWSFDAFSALGAPTEPQRLAVELPKKHTTARFKPEGESDTVDAPRA